jgi:hypothetical protein
VGEVLLVLLFIIFHVFFERRRHGDEEKTGRRCCRSRTGRAGSSTIVGAGGEGGSRDCHDVAHRSREEPREEKSPVRCDRVICGACLVDPTHLLRASASTASPERRL